MGLLTGLGAPVPEPYDGSEECCFVIHALLTRSLTSRLISRSLQGLVSDIARVHQVWSNSLEIHAALRPTHLRPRGL
jgi:hypothetical protein